MDPDWLTIPVAVVFFGLTAFHYSEWRLLKDSKK